MSHENHAFREKDHLTIQIFVTFVIFIVDDNEYTKTINFSISIIQMSNKSLNTISCELLKLTHLLYIHTQQLQTVNLVIAYFFLM